MPILYPKLTLESSSHILHSFFWTNLSTKPIQPTGDLLRRIEQKFGSFEQLNGLLAYLSKNVDGNGWGRPRRSGRRIFQVV